MGNFTSGLFATSAEKEFKRLTKKNTKANRDGVPAPNGKPEGAEPPRPESMPRSSSGSNIRFGKLVTEVTYDHEAGEIEVAQEALYAPDDSGEDEPDVGAAQSPTERRAMSDAGPMASAQARKKAILRNAGSFNAGAQLRAASQGSSGAISPLGLDGRV